MGAPPQPEPILETGEIFFVNRVENRHYRLLDKLVLQSSNPQGASPPIGLGNVDPPRRLRPVRAPMNPAMKVLDGLQPFGHVMQQGGEPQPPISLRRLPQTVEPA